MRLVDLHIHTTFSDGRERPADIVREALDMGYERIAITDHDTGDGIGEAAEAARGTALDVVGGIEFSTDLSGTELHILGYGMDISHPLISGVSDEMMEKRHLRNVRMVDALNDMGYDITWEEIRREQENRFVGKPVIAGILAGKGYAATVSEVFDTIFERPGIKSLEKGRYDSRDVIGRIVKAGGHAVLAHPVQAGKSYEETGRIVDILMEAGLSGMECFHPDQDLAAASHYAEMASSRGLFITKGSDFHGSSFRDKRDCAYDEGILRRYDRYDIIKSGF